MFTSPFANPDEAIMVYTDGSYVFRGHNGAQAYGWVVANPTGSMESHRVVSSPVTRKDHKAANHMESAAIVDALAEFAPLGRRIIIHSDSQSLSSLLAKIAAGTMAEDELLLAKGTIRRDDARRLLALMKTVDFEIKWIKGHGKNFNNLVVDQMCRIAGLDGGGDEAGLEFGQEALAAGEAVIWGRCKGPEGCYSGYFLAQANGRRRNVTA